jgi:voltage-gated potassium channel
MTHQEDIEATSLRGRLYRALEPQARDGLSPLNMFLIGLVLFSLALFAFETEFAAQALANMREGISVDNALKQTQTTVWWINLGVLIVFAIEYILRLWAVSEDPRYHGVLGRIRYMFTPYALADLAAFLPELLLMGAPNAAEAGSVAALKALRLLRLFKLARFIPAFEVLGAALRRAGSQLLVALALALALVYLSAIVLYFVEGSVQEGFASIPRSLWWAVATLTTVGYGDIYPVTVAGRIAAGVIALVGIGVVALPAGIFATSFAEELKERQMARQDRTNPPQ